MNRSKYNSPSCQMSWCDVDFVFGENLPLDGTNSTARDRPLSFSPPKESSGVKGKNHFSRLELWLRKCPFVPLKLRGKLESLYSTKQLSAATKLAAKFKPLISFQTENFNNRDSINTSIF